MQPYVSTGKLEAEVLAGIRDRDFSKTFLR
jgi:hypothetical protein